MAIPGRAYLARTIRYRALRQGLLGGSRPWLVVFVLLRLGAWSRRVTKRGPMPVRFSERLAVGEGLVIRHLPPDEGAA